MPLDHGRGEAAAAASRGAAPRASDPAVEDTRLVRSSKAASRSQCPICLVSLFASEATAHVQACVNSLPSPTSNSSSRLSPVNPVSSSQTKRPRNSPRDEIPSSPSNTFATTTTTTTTTTTAAAAAAAVAAPPAASAPQESSRIVKIRLPRSAIPPKRRSVAVHVPPTLPPPLDSPPPALFLAPDSFAAGVQSEPDRFRSFFAKAAAMAAAHAQHGHQPRDVELVDLGDGFTVIASREPFFDGMGEGELRSLRAEVIHLLESVELYRADVSTVRKDNTTLRTRLVQSELALQTAHEQLGEFEQGEARLREELRQWFRTAAENQTEREACEEANAVLLNDLTALRAELAQARALSPAYEALKLEKSNLQTLVTSMQSEIDALKTSAKERDEEEYANLLRAWVVSHGGSVSLAALAVFHGVKPLARVLWGRLCPATSDSDAVRRHLCEKFNAQLGLTFLLGPPAAVEVKGSVSAAPEEDLILHACQLVRGNGGYTAWRTLAHSLGWDGGGDKACFFEALRVGKDGQLFAIDSVEGIDALVVAASHTESVLVGFFCDFLAQNGGILEAAKCLADIASSQPGVAQLRSRLGDAAKPNVLASGHPDRLEFWPASDGLSAMLALPSEHRRVLKLQEQALTEARAQDARRQSTVVKALSEVTVVASSPPRPPPPLPPSPSPQQQPTGPVLGYDHRVPPMYDQHQHAFAPSPPPPPPPPRSWFSPPQQHQQQQPQQPAFFFRPPPRPFFAHQAHQHHPSPVAQHHPALHPSQHQIPHPQQLPHPQQPHPPPHRLPGGYHAM